MLRLVHARQLRRRDLGNLLREAAVGQRASALACHAGGNASRAAGRRRGGASALDKPNGAATPRVIGRAEDIRVGNAGHAQQLLADFGGVDVLAAGDEHVVGAFLDVQLAIGRNSGRIARQEKAVGRVGGARV